MKLETFLQKQKAKISKIENIVSELETIQNNFPQQKFVVFKSKIDFSPQLQNPYYQPQSKILLHSLQKVTQQICCSDSSLMTDFQIIVNNDIPNQTTRLNFFPFFTFQNTKIFLTKYMRYACYPYSFISLSDYSVRGRRPRQEISFLEEVEKTNLSSSLKGEIISFISSVQGYDKVYFSQFIKE